MSDPRISLQLQLERPVVRNDQPSEIDLAISAIATSEAHTKPRHLAQNICVVIDRSGSMAGDKLQAAKLSCIEILGRLAPEDQLIVVAFNEKAEVIINPNTDMGGVVEKLNNLTANGSTNLSLGWYLGLLELQSYFRDGQANRLILLSDGQANQGETKRSVLAEQSAKAREQGITTSTVGIGDDFEEDLLQAIAAESGGRFWFIQESRIKDIIDEEFRDSLSVVIDRPRIELLLSDGIKVSREINALRKYGGKYHLRPLTAKDTFSFAIRLEIDPLKTASTTNSISAVLHDGDMPCARSEIELKLVPPGQFLLTPSNPFVEAVVRQYETFVAGEQIVEKLDEGNLSFIQNLLVDDIEGRRVASGQLAEKHDTMRDLLRHSRTSEVVFTCSRVTSDLIRVGEEFENFDATKSFTGRWRKLLRADSSRSVSGRLSQKQDSLTHLEFIEDTLRMVNRLLDEKPDHKGLLEIRTKCEELIIQVRSDIENAYDPEEHAIGPD